MKHFLHLQLGKHLIRLSLPYYRSAIGGHMNTWRREVNRLKTKYNCEKVPLFTLLRENRITWFAAFHIAILLFIFKIFGFKAVKFQLAYSLIGVFFIELINYTEHYGLLR